jgi:hypothetical protein
MTAVEARADLAGAPPVVHGFVRWLETGQLSDGLLTEDLFTDFTMPIWRLQAGDRAAGIALRAHGHPSPGKVTRLRYDPTPSGFVLELEEEWDEHELGGRARGEHWYCREMIRADIRDGVISQLSVYCTGDWDSAQIARHQAEVRLIRP